MAKATLLIVQGVDQGARFTIGSAPVELGRGVQNQIRLHDTEASRQHATLKYDDGHFVLTDLNSSNGTFVNGKPVQQVQLHDGDQIQIGCGVILFSVLADDESRIVHERVDFSGQSDIHDPSSIISELSDDDGSQLIEQVHGDAAIGSSQTLTNLQTLYRISEIAVSPSVSLDQLLKRILDLTIHVSGADRGCVLVADAQTREIRPFVFSRRRNLKQSGKMRVSRSIVDYVLERGQGVRTSDAQHDRRFGSAESILQGGVREAMCVPMPGRSDLMGVIYVDITTPAERLLLENGPQHRFSEDHLRLLFAIGRQAALAVENNRYQQANVKAERLAAMGQAVAGLSHDIKNILQGVRGGSYLIDRGLKEHDETLVGKGWTIVERNQNRIYHLVMDMLTFSKERRPVLQLANLRETVEDVCELMRAQAEDAHIKLQLATSGEVPQSTFDPEGIHRAVLNVVKNAIEAVQDQENSEVTVIYGYDSNDERLYVDVSDNGPGIAEEQLPVIFDAFESSKGPQGTGLGLAVSRKIVREHGGDIVVESKEGEGTRFTLWWPKMEEERQESTKTQHQLST